MRYRLTEFNYVEPIKKIEWEGRIITNPTDEFIDEHSLGYPFDFGCTDTSRAPEHDEETQVVHGHHAIVNGIITYVWEIQNRSPEELRQRYQSQIDKIYQESENFKKNGRILYPETGKEYIPRWAYEYYNTVLISKEYHFPTPESTLAVTAVDGTSDDFTLIDFIGLYEYICSAFAEYTAEQNQQIAELNAKIAALNLPPAEPVPEFP